MCFMSERYKTAKETARQMAREAVGREALKVLSEQRRTIARNLIPVSMLVGAFCGAAVCWGVMTALRSFGLI